MTPITSTCIIQQSFFFFFSAKHNTYQLLDKVIIANTKLFYSQSYRKLCAVITTNEPEIQLLLKEIVESPADNSITTSEPAYDTGSDKDTAVLYHGSGASLEVFSVTHFQWQ